MRSETEMVRTCEEEMYRCTNAEVWETGFGCFQKR